MTGRGREMTSKQELTTADVERGLEEGETESLIEPGGPTKSTANLPQHSNGEAQPDKGSEAQSFLQKQKSRIYTGRDFATTTLSARQKISLLIAFIVLCFIIKAILVDPFRTDTQRWEAKKAFVDEAVKTEVLKHPELLAAAVSNDRISGGVFSVNETALLALEREAEEFVKEEEGDQI